MKCCRCQKSAVGEFRTDAPGRKGRWKPYCHDHLLTYRKDFEASFDWISIYEGEQNAVVFSSRITA